MIDENINNRFEAGKHAFDIFSERSKRYCVLCFNKIVHSYAHHIGCLVYTPLQIDLKHWREGSIIPANEGISIITEVGSLTELGRLKGITYKVLHSNVVAHGFFNTDTPIICGGFAETVSDREKRFLRIWAAQPLTIQYLFNLWAPLEKVFTESQRDFIQWLEYRN